MGGASHQERAHVDHATDWMRPPSYLVFIGGGMAVVGGVMFVLNSTSMNGLFLLGFLLTVFGIGLAGLASEKLPGDLVDAPDGATERMRDGWQTWVSPGVQGKENHDRNA